MNYFNFSFVSRSMLSYYSQGKFCKIEPYTNFIPVSNVIMKYCVLHVIPSFYPAKTARAMFEDKIEITEVFYLFFYSE